MPHQRGNEAQIIEWLKADPFCVNALEIAAKLELKDWCLAAGFVRNLVWDRLHGYAEPTPLNDIDFIYFDDTKIDADMDRELEQKLILSSGLPWSLKNQARMHIRNNDAPYKSTSDAMSYWVETETAIGATVINGDVALIAPFGCDALFANTITINKKRIKKEDFKKRLVTKKWLEIWPKLKVL